MTSLRIVAALAAALATQGALGACDSPESRQFDFWVGQWQVHKKDGTVVAVSNITSEYDGCVVHEHYMTGRGSSGESLNAYDPARKVWHQTWVDNAGQLLVLEGGLDGKSMVLSGQSIGSSGKAYTNRITWTPNPDGTVRQLWEVGDGKGPWKSVFDGLYTRK